MRAAAPARAKLQRATSRFVQPSVRRPRCRTPPSRCRCRANRLPRTPPTPESARAALPNIDSWLWLLGLPSPLAAHGGRAVRFRFLLRIGAILEEVDAHPG